jgi:chromosome segregation and condensation protein ScpB
MDQIVERTGLTLQEINTIISRKPTEKMCKKMTIKENREHCENNGITIEHVHEEVQTMKHEMKELKNNIKELIELIQSIYEFSEE